MVFLTSLNILDTGFLDVATRTNQLATGNRANSGAALQLKGVNFDIVSSSNLDKGVTPAFSPASIRGHEKRALVSINPTQVTITVLLNSKNTNTSNVWGINDMAILGALIALPHTKGFKALYYPVDNAATDTGGDTTRSRAQQAVYQLGGTDTTESQGDLDLTLWDGNASTTGYDLTDVKYIPVRFNSCSITQTTKNLIKITLQGLVTG